MIPSLHRRRFSRVAVISAGALALAAVSLATPTAASATTQPVTVVTTVNGGTTNTTFTGDVTTATFAVTNASTNGSKLGAFSIVVPKGLGPVKKAGVNGPGTWLETILPCGSQANCSAIVLVNAWFPLTKSVVGPGGTVRASISFTAPSTAQTLSFSLIGIGNGIFTVSGATPTVNVVDVAASKLGVSVTQPVVAGATRTLTVTPLTDAGVATTWRGGPVTLTITGDDSRATIDASAFGGSSTLTFPAGKSASVVLPNVPAGGAFSAPITFFAAQDQDVTATAVPLSGTAGGFSVTGGTATGLALAHVDAGTGLIDPTVPAIRDDSTTPALPNPVAGKPFIVDVALVDSWGNASPTAGTAVTLAKTGATPGTLTAPPVTTGSNGGASFAASYSDAANPLGLLATAGSFAAPGSTTITSTGTSADLTPNTPAVLAVGGTTANLGNGGRGPAFLFSQPCTNVDTATNCGTRTTEVTLEGSFKDANGVALYGFNTPARPLKPASLSFICAAAVCPHADSGEPRTDYLYNSPAVDPGPYSQADVNEFEQVEDFNRWPLQFAIKNNDGNYPTNLDGSIAFANAPSCVDLDPAHAGITGVIQSQAAQTAGFCLDVYALSRTANGNGVQQFSGDLTRTILFVEDPKARTP